MFPKKTEREKNFLCFKKSAGCRRFGVASKERYALALSRKEGAWQSLRFCLKRAPAALALSRKKRGKLAIWLLYQENARGAVAFLSRKLKGTFGG